MDHLQQPCLPRAPSTFFRTIYSHLKTILYHPIPIIGDYKACLRTDFFPMPIINIVWIGSLFDNPSWISFSPLRHTETVINQ